MPVQCNVRTLSNAVNLLLMYNKQIDHKMLEWRDRANERARERETKEGKTNDDVDDDGDGDRHRTFTYYVCEHKYILKRERVVVCVYARNGIRFTVVFAQ